MNVNGTLALVLAFTSFSALARNTSTECTLKKNPRNKVYIDFSYNGNNLEKAKVLLLIQTSSGVKDFTYYNYAFMTDAMNYREYIPYGRRAEVKLSSDQLSFNIVNYNASTPSVILTADKNSKKTKFNAKLETILKTENVSGLENGTTLTVNEVTCVQREL